jgi:hypothetical protein
VFVSGDTTAPTVTISAPADGSSATGTVQVTATASDNIAVSGVQFQVDGAPLGAEVVTAPYAVTWDSTGAADGPHTIAAVARDAAGNRSQSSIAVTVSNAPPEPEPDTTAPVVSLLAPQNQSTVGGTIAVTASATDDVAIVGVLLQVDGTPIGAELTAAPYSLTWNTVPAGNGPHTLTAVARDAAGNTAQSSVVVTVFNDTTDETAIVMPDCRKLPASGRAAAFHDDETEGTAHAGYLRFNLANLAEAVDSGFPPGTDGRPSYEVIHRLDGEELSFDVDPGEWDPQTAKRTLVPGNAPASFNAFSFFIFA